MISSLLFEHDLFGKPVSTFPDHALEVAEPEHVGHRIKPGLLALGPHRCPQCTVREDHAILGAVRQLDALMGTGKDHAVIAGDGAAAQRRKADVAGLPGTGIAVAAPRRMFPERDFSALGGGFAE